MTEIRDLGAEFTRREVVPHLQAWEDAGSVSRELHLAAAKQGLLGVAFPAILRAFKADPGIAAGPVVLAAADVATLLFYFGIGTRFLSATL